MEHLTHLCVLFCALVVGHALCDFPLQGDFMAKAKNHKAPIPGVNPSTVLGMHAAIHGGAVAVVTGVWWLGLAEFWTHYGIDYLKCEGKLTFAQDQQLHVLCKAAWALFAIAVTGVR